MSASPVRVHTHLCTQNPSITACSSLPCPATPRHKKHASILVQGEANEMEGEKRATQLTFRAWTAARQRRTLSLSVCENKENKKRSEHHRRHRDPSLRVCLLASFKQEVEVFLP